jgi:type VI protein secretion system component Hcp
LRYELKNVRAVSFQVNASGNDEFRPTEEVAFNFEEIKVTHTEYDESGSPKGKTEYSWKVEKGE